MPGKTMPLSLFLLAFGMQAAGAVAGADASHGCTTQIRHGLPVPDPKCTPGAVNPTVTLAVLKNPAFRTGCVRDCATSEDAKAASYEQYGIRHPSGNHGSTQTCELDHLVSLELGGADTLDNIWPQCGPDDVELAKRYFKQKDAVEYYLAQQVRDGKMDLKKAQKAIASDWTQFLTKARGFCSAGAEKCQNGD